MMNTIYIPSLWYQFTFIREHYTYFVGGSITTVQLTSSSTGLDSTKQSSKYVVNCIKHATESKPVKLETVCTVMFLV